MKQIFTIIALALTTMIFAQAPQGMNYQATIRNTEGSLIINQSIILKFSIIQGTPTSTAIYQEQHTSTTDDLGAVALVIGQGTPLTGNFNQINWSLGNYFISIEVNTGSGFATLGTTQLLSVPYALYSQQSGASGANTILITKALLKNNSSIYADYSVPTYQDDYEATGYYVGLQPNPTQTTSIYENESSNEFRFTSDLFFNIPVGTTPNTTFYIRAWIRKSDGTHIYSIQRTIITN